MTKTELRSLIKLLRSYGVSSYATPEIQLKFQNNAVAKLHKSENPECTIKPKQPEFPLFAVKPPPELEIPQLLEARALKEQASEVANMLFWSA